MCVQGTILCPIYLLMQANMHVCMVSLHAHGFRSSRDESQKVLFVPAPHQS